MKVNKLFSLMLVIVMLMATPVFAADNGSVSAREKDSAKIDFSLEGRNVNVLSLKDGKLESYDDNGVKTTIFLTQEQIEEKLAEFSPASTDQIGTMSYDSGEINMYVPKNINGNQGAVVGRYSKVSPDKYLNLEVISLPQTSMPTINVSFTNEDEDDVSWKANVYEDELVWTKVKYPNERYAVKVSTEERYPSNARLRVFTD
ncbi:hypothetical protein FLT15_25680 [Paenibacillus thiaminolyticus]|uniref:hypothetical protein n=1 Tax=Paenibacillus thiaminolyticus TaxID=49283 RepID=UPI00116500AB|nr:hypothetical protein [Paenibacillus thiaminolyticus]NGP61614.1 hypothetical protein [Paenibacillus thiaminolyticus]